MISCSRTSSRIESHGRVEDLVSDYFDTSRVVLLALQVMKEKPYVSFRSVS